VTDPLRRRLAAGLAALGLLLALGAVGALAVRHDLASPYLGYEGPEIFVEVPPGASGRGIARLLEQEGVVPSAPLLRLYLRATGLGSRMQAGEYRFSRPLSPMEAVDRLVRGDVFLHRLTVPEGLDLAEVEALLVGAGYWKAGEVRQALGRVEIIRDLAPEAGSLEGYLFPETYAFPRSTGAAELVRDMTDRFREVFGPRLREAARARGLSVHEAVTLASLVEEEGRLVEESPLIASVIHNRLGRRMRLEVDATVVYALRREGLYRPPLTRRDLGFASPYNTYQNAGLPPGPIAGPGRAALEAAALPAETDYLYYVLKPDGSGAHAFSRTYREHLREVRRLRRGRSF